MKIHTLSQDAFPPELLEIPSSPKRLWLRGNLSPTVTNRLAVVGGRSLSCDGEEAFCKLVDGLADYPMSVVSGLALGAWRRV